MRHSVYNVAGWHYDVFLSPQIFHNNKLTWWAIIGIILIMVVGIPGCCGGP